MKKNFTLLLGLFSMAVATAQRIDDMTNYPVPPQTAAIFKALAAPVSYYTGQPDISIPLYTIQQDGVEIPIKIAFSTNGITVDEEATNVGLGVRLDWGGSITRTVNGSPDERFFFSDPYIMDDLGSELPKDYSNFESTGCYPYCGTANAASSMKLMERLNYYLEANKYNDPFKMTSPEAHKDFRPDLFNYSALDKSGQFRFDQAHGSFVTYPLDDIKIDKTFSFYGIQKFDLTKSDGVKITFGEGAQESVYKNTLGNEYYTQSWFVKRISTVKNSTIEYTYLDNQYYKTNLRYGDLWSPYISGGPSSPGGSDNFLYTEKLVKTITFKLGKLEFEYSNDRVDVPATDSSSGLPNAGQPAPRLNKIVLYDKNNQPLKTFRFYHSYFGGSESPAIDYKRLKLDSLAIQDNAAITKEVYRFVYNTATTYPSKKTYSKDHWGYYNGPNSNSSPIPSTSVPAGDNGQYNNGMGWSGYDNWHDRYMQDIKSNRFINTAANKIFTIKKVIFPTGGEREYVFENHEVRWYEAFDKMKDISNDGYDIFQAKLRVSGPTLATTDQTNEPTSGNSNERTVYSAEFPMEDVNDMPVGEPSFYIRSSYVNKNIPSSQINSWTYKVEIGLQRKVNGVWSGNFYPYQTNDYYNSNLLSYPYTISHKRITGWALPNGTYRIYVKMTCPPQYVMNTWLNQYGQVVNYAHETVVGLAWRKKNFGNIRMGGFRIKQIVDRDPVNEYVTNYEYVDQGNYCSGKAVSIPEYKENIVSAIASSTPNQIQQYYGDYYGYRICPEAVVPLTKTQGSNVGYTNVTKRIVGGTQNIKEDFVYSYTPSLQSGYWREYYFDTEPKPWQSGKLLADRKYKGNDLVSEDVYEYYGMTNETDKGFAEEINTSLVKGRSYLWYENFSSGWHNVDQVFDFEIFKRDTPLYYSGLTLYPTLYFFDKRSDAKVPFYSQSSGAGYILLTVSPPAKIPYFRHYTGFDKIKKKTKTNYFSSGPVTETENYFYDALPAYTTLSRQETTTSTGEVLSAKFYYPQDLLSDPLMAALVSKNRTGNPVRTENFSSASKVSEEKFTYLQDAATNLLLPKEVYSAKFPNTLTSIPNVGNLEKKISFDLYDDDGNLIQYTNDSGITTSVIWGYNKSLPIAKIENAAYSAVSGYVSNLQAKSDLPATAANENALIADLNTMRNATALQGAMVTTYTYKPLLGVSSVTDPKAYSVYYVYDSFGRLDYAKDKYGNRLSENVYHYKP